MSGSYTLDVVDDEAALAAALARAFLRSATRALAAGGRFDVALAGGSTPKAAYRLLARDATLDWSRVRFFFGDERCVPPVDDESNYRMAREALLEPLSIPGDHVFRMRGEAEPAEAAQTYATTLIRELGAVPTLDLVMLGLGPDAHTASLFPGSDPFADQERLVRAPWVAKVGSHRLTLTPAVLNAARGVVFATGGDAKADALYAVLEGRYDPSEAPAQAVAPTQGDLAWIVDRAASRRLNPRTIDGHAGVPPPS